MGYFCNECKKGISSEEYRFSKEKYSRALCMTDQKMNPSKEMPRKKSNITKKPASPQAIKLAEALRKIGWNPELEKFDGYKHIDIAIVKAKVNIEVDGKHHNASDKQALADLKRTFHSFRKGYVTLRIPNCLVKSDKTIEETARYISKFLNESLSQLESEGDF